MVLSIVEDDEEFTLRRTIVAGRRLLRRKKPNWDTINILVYWTIWSRVTQCNGVTMKWSVTR